MTVTQTSDKLLHIVWAETGERIGFAGKRIGYATSSDTGKSWSAPRYLDPKQLIRHPRVVADRDNNLHLVFQGSQPNGSFWPALYHTVRPAGGDWSEPAILFGDTTSARHPELTITKAGELVLLFSQYLGMRGEHPWFASAISRLRPGRDCAVSH